MALTVGELNVKLEASAQEFQDQIADVENQLDDLADTSERAGVRAEKGFLNFGNSLALASLSLKAASLAGVSFGGTLARIALAIPGVRLALIGVGVALASIGLGRFAKEGIPLSAAFEQIAVSLGILTGSAESAEAVLKDVNKIVLATPFGLSELANVSRTLAVVFGENTAAISEFTQITADIAAISGRPVEQIGQQIQRAITSGLASAEVLRESGITPLLVEAAGAADSAALSGDALLDAFRALTAEGGRGFGAAAAQAKTLEGALSNAAIAVEGFKRAFGDAIAPATITRAMNTQAAFVSLEEAIKDVTPAIGAVATIMTFLTSRVLNTGVFLVRTLSLAFTGLANGLAVIQVAIFSVAAIFDVFFTNIGTISEGVIQLVTGRLTEAFETFGSIDLGDSAVVQGLGDAFDTLVEGSESVATSFRGFLRSSTILEGLANAIGIVTDESLLEAKATRDATEANKENVASLNDRTKAQQKVAEELRKIRTAQVTPEGIRTRIEALDEEIRRVGMLDAADVDRVRQAAILNQLARERLELTDQLQVAQNRLPAILDAVNEQIQGLAKIDPRAARDFAEQLAEGLEGAGLDPTARLEAAQQIAQQLRDLNEDAEIASAERIARAKVTAEKAADKERETAATRLAAITARAQLDRLEGLAKDIELVNRQIEQAERLGKLTGDRAKTEEAINLLKAQRLALVEMETEQLRLQTESQQVLPEVLAGINEQIAQLARLDPEAAAEFALDLQAGLIKAGQDPVAALEFAANLSQALREKLAELKPEGFGPGIVDTIAGPLESLFTGEAGNFGDLLGQSILDKVGPSLDEVFSDAIKDFGALLQDVFDDLDLFQEGGALGGLGGFFGTEAGKQLGTIGLGILGEGIKAAFKDEDITSEAASGITSAVTSTQAVRGIVAGPTSIAVAQVDRAISDAFIETNRILRLIEQNTRSTAASTSDLGTGSVPSGGTSEATQALGNEGPSLV